MCGRFTLAADPRTLSTAFELADVPDDLAPRYNVAPSQLVAVVGLKSDGTTRGLTRLRWGFVPSWATDPDAGPRPINAKAESVALKPPFKHAFRERRCLVPADGFFEWHADGSRKQAYHFRPRDGAVFALAGVWDCWRGTGRTLLTCAVITVPANATVRPYHDRMPAILRRGGYVRWLDPRTPVPTLLDLLRPLPDDALDAVPVGPAVNRVANDGPECVAAVVSRQVSLPFE